MKKILSFKNLTVTIILNVIFCLFLFQSAKAQFVEDALRFIKPNSAQTARVGALGGSYFGFSDDASAILTNPAGLTLISGELGLGFNYNSNNISTNFFNNIRENTKGEFYFSNVQFVFPTSMESSENSYNVKFGFSYSVENDFVANTRYSGYNSQNSFIAEQANQRQEWTIATEVADGNFDVAVKNNVQQDGFVYEDGGLHNLAFGFGMDLNEIFSLGATFMLKFGTYNYSKTYYETDTKNLHQTLNSLTVKDKLTQELFGISGIIGFQAKIHEMCRLGLAVKFPTLLSDSGNFATSYKAAFDVNPNTGNADILSYSTDYFMQNYSIVTPFEFTLGLSGNIWGLSYSLAGSYQDASATYFTDFSDYENLNDLIYFDDLNETITHELKEQFTFGAGLEYRIPATPLYVRGSYTVITSPYVNEDFGGNKSIFAGGLGIVLTENFIIDAAFSYTNYEAQRANYGSLDVPALFSSYKTTYTPKSYMLGFRYRF